MRRTLSTSRFFRFCGATRRPAKFRPNGGARRSTISPHSACAVGRTTRSPCGEWQLRRNLTAYDAAYIALAEALGAPLLTRDRRLASAPEIRARVEVA